MCSFAMVRTSRRTTVKVTQVPQIDGHGTMNKVSAEDETHELRVFACDIYPIAIRALRVSNKVRSKSREDDSLVRRWN